MGWWFRKLFARGQKLVEVEGKEEIETLSTKKNDYEDSSFTHSTLLYSLAMEYLKAKMGLNEKYEMEKKAELANILKTDNAILRQKYDKTMARRIIMKRLRCSLIKHPYDYIGRKMAIEAKKVFLREVLGEHHWWHNLGNFFKIPDCIRNHPEIQNFLILVPVIFAGFELAYKGSVFSYDVYSDVEVLKDLNNVHDSFKMPQVFDLPNSTLAFKDLFLSKIPDKGLKGLRYPCEVLDLMESIVNEKLIFYKRLFSKVGDVHFSPNRKSSHHISEVFKILEEIAKVYDDVKTLYKRYDSEGFGSTPKDIPDLVSKLSSKMKKSRSNLSGFFIWLFGGSDVSNVKSILSKGSNILDYVLEEILKGDLAKDILKEGDRRSKEQLFANFSVMDFAREFGKEMKTIWNPITIRNFSFNPDDDIAGNLLNKTQLECRKYVVKLFDLKKNDMIRESITEFYLAKKSSNNVNNVNEGANSKLNFMTKHVMRSAWLFLCCTLIYTFAVEIVKVFFEIVQFGDWPFVTNYRLKRDENDPNSDLFNGGNTQNSYVRQASKRFTVNINEATKETLSAVNIQIALYFYMATFLFNYRRAMYGILEQDIPDILFGLTENSFTQFRKSAMMNSLVAGIISLTFAQYKQYMLRHSGDVEMCGKLVYFAACFFNSGAIFITQVIYYALGLPFLLSLLLIVIRYIVGFDAFDDLPDSSPTVIFFLIIIFVLLPLKFIPISVGRMLKYIADDLIIQKKTHIAQRNRSGYEVPGFETALYMFLPSATNHTNQLTSVAPGFSYFSRDPLSRKLYRLKFEVQIFCKCMMHLFYVASSFVLINTIHIFLQLCTVQNNAYYLSSLQVKEVKTISKRTISIKFLASFPYLVPP